MVRSTFLAKTDQSKFAGLEKAGLPPKNIKVPTSSASMVFTKSDKISQTQISKNINKYKEEMLKYWESLPEIFITSSEKQIGTNDILNFIEKYNKGFDPTLVQ